MSALTNSYKWLRPRQGVYYGNKCRVRVHKGWGFGMFRNILKLAPEFGGRCGLGSFQWYQEGCPRAPSGKASLLCQLKRHHKDTRAGANLTYICLGKMRKRLNSAHSSFCCIYHGRRKHDGQKRKCLTFVAALLRAIEHLFHG